MNGNKRIADGAGTKFATANGVTMLIVNGSTNGNLRRVLNGESVGTIFPRREST